MRRLLAKRKKMEKQVQETKEVLFKVDSALDKITAVDEPTVSAEHEVTVADATGKSLRATTKIFNSSRHAPKSMH